jgi:integrase
VSSNNIVPNPQRSTSEQRAVAARNTGRFGDRKPSKRYFEAAPCEGPGCTNVVPAGDYPAQRMRSFCSDSCRNRDSASAYIVGKCRHCDQDILGRKDQPGKKLFCNETHRYEFLRERVLGPTGSFRPIVEEYMAGDAKNHYKASTIPTVQCSVAKFFRFAFAHGITDVRQVRSSTITQFIAEELERGTISRVYVGHLSTFFGWLIDEGRYDRVNPIIPRRHYKKLGEPEARPYNDHDRDFIWAIVEESGRIELMLAFMIGLECGLRIGEVANIRLEDVDARAQKIFVRLPTKNNRTRTVPFHDKVQKYLALWLEIRNPHCQSDHLLHNNALKPFNQNQLDARFKKLLRNEGGPASSFHFHRLRHTWATNLMNNGMELAVLKELGGWQNWTSMQRYIKVLDVTVRRQYEAAYKRLQEKQESGEDETISFLDFIHMSDSSAVTIPDSAS